MARIPLAWRQAVSATLLTSVAMTAGAGAEPVAETPTADAAAYRSAFESYVAFDADAPVLGWREVNDRVGPRAGPGSHGAHAAPGTAAPSGPAAQAPGQDAGAAAPARAEHDHGAVRVSPEVREPVPEDEARPATTHGHAHATPRAAPTPATPRGESHDVGPEEHRP
jgi:hypothetical protein